MTNGSFSIAVTRAFLRTIGQTSTGIRMCFEYGLTAGKTVDYVYRNQPSGWWGIGRLIDRWFLAHPGWEAVRIRRQHLEQLVVEAILELRTRGRRISLLDIASGPALYILSVLGRVGEQDITARCQDIDERWLRDGASEAAARHLQHVQFERGDAFNRDALLALRPQPNLAISSGFYDWITQDDVVQRSLAMLFDALEPGGCLVVTNQMAHPNLAMASGVFTDFTHQPLKMTMRPASQLQDWLHATGFVVERTLVDAWGYYSVMKARKP